MKRSIELLAPGGDLDAIKAAVVAGADAIYCGLDRFNARHRAANITFDELGGVLALAHRHGCRVYLTLNIMMVETDIPVLVGILNKLVNTSIDGVIVGDLGLLQLLSTSFPGLEVHASTQLTTHNQGQLEFLRELGAGRANLCRELSLEEIRPLVRAGHAAGLSLEVFVHGSYCISFSGICTMSSIGGGNSGNRGRCSQPCRDRYLTTPAGKDFPLNLKDNAAYFDLQRLADAGVDALKLEGRMKTFHYVYTVTNTYKQRLRSLQRGDEPADHSAELYKVFNRDFSNGFLTGEVSRQMFSDHPRNLSAAQLREGDRTRDEAYDAIAGFKAAVSDRIAQVSAAKAPLTVRVSGRSGTPLKLTVHAAEASFEVASTSALAPQRSDSTVPPLDAQWLTERLKAVNETEYVIDRLELEALEPGLFVPLRELTAIKRQILSWLNGSRAPIDPVEAPRVSAGRGPSAPPALSVLVAASEDLLPCAESGAVVHVRLPSALKSSGPALAALFQDAPGLIPWFPAVLIGEDYAAAVRLLQRLRPRRIVTNNTGVAHAAWRAGIPWIAGPRLNIANSLSLLGLQQRFACRGAFVSNELSQAQIRRITPPEDFELHYSIYHPVQLLTSRQCLLHQVSGCDKETLDQACIDDCERSATITNHKGASYLIKKSRGSYASIYHPVHFLNTEIVTDLPQRFSSFLVDLTEVETETRAALDKPGLIQLFAALLRGDADAGSQLQRCIRPTTKTLYQKGV